MNKLNKQCYVELANSPIEDTVGFSIIDNEPHVIFPRGYNIATTSGGIYKDALLLVKVLDKYQRRKGENIFDRDKVNMKLSNGERFPLRTAIWLIKDYQYNGLYSEKIDVYKVQKKGKIDWPKTIKKQMPQISGNQYVYLDFVVKESCHDMNNIIRIIHEKIIHQCLQAIGWLFPNVEKPNANALSYSKEHCIITLKKEQQKTTHDNKKVLLNHMIEFLQAANDDNSKDIFKNYKTSYFNLVWQDMLEYVFGNEPVSEYYPNATWYVQGKAYEASNLQPDIILKRGEIAYILDAKYYKYGITRNIAHLPQSSDIVKQLAYSNYAEDSCLRGIVTAYDAFIMPYNGGEDLFEVVGYSSIGNSMFNSHKVVAVLMDIKEVMKLYTSSNQNTQKQHQLIQLINNVNRD